MYDEDTPSDKAPVRDTDSIFKSYREILCVHHDPVVLKGLEATFDQPDIKTHLVLSNGEILPETVLSRKFNLYVLPSDPPLPQGGLSAWVSRLPSNSQVVFLTQQPVLPNPNSQLASAPNVDFYGFAKAEQLKDPRYGASFKWLAEQLLDDSPARILKFLKYERVEAHIQRRFKRNGTDANDATADSLDDLFKKISRDHYDRLYAPESLRDHQEDIRKHSRQATLLILFFKPNSNVYVFEL